MEQQDIVETSSTILEATVPSIKREQSHSEEPLPVLDLTLPSVKVSNPTLQCLSPSIETPLGETANVSPLLTNTAGHLQSSALSSDDGLSSGVYETEPLSSGILNASMALGSLGRVNPPAPTLLIANSNFCQDIRKESLTNPASVHLQHHPAYEQQKGLSDAPRHPEHRQIKLLQQERKGTEGIPDSKEDKHMSTASSMILAQSGAKSRYTMSDHEVAAGSNEFAKMPSSKVNGSIEPMGCNGSEMGIDYDGQNTDYDHFLIYTKAVRHPKLLNIIREKRFILRFSTSAFVGMSITSFWNSYTSSTESGSGLNAMCFTSITSMFVSLCCMLLYAFPAFLGIPPHRHWCFSGVEIFIDAVLAMLWLGASTRLAVYARCPENMFGVAPNGSNTTYLVDISTSNCFAWPFSISTGFCCLILYLVTFTMGIRDWKRQIHAKAIEKYSHVMFARGNWN
ncbi:hypothetical protein BASA60_010323 [Batrachochytrium salamandrivorans]|nr:hypothetical protein BASA60_010323 [Batrachochytrium salamandrivorans]